MVRPDSQLWMLKWLKIITLTILKEHSKRWCQVAHEERQEEEHTSSYPDLFTYPEEHESFRPGLLTHLLATGISFLYNSLCPVKTQTKCQRLEWWHLHCFNYPASLVLLDLLSSSQTMKKKKKQWLSWTIQFPSLFFTFFSPGEWTLGKVFVSIIKTNSLKFWYAENEKYEPLLPFLPFFSFRTLIFLCGFSKCQRLKAIHQAVFWGELFVLSYFFFKIRNREHLKNTVSPL